MLVKQPTRRERSVPVVTLPSQYLPSNTHRKLCTESHPNTAKAGPAWAGAFLHFELFDFIQRNLFCHSHQLSLPLSFHTVQDRRSLSQAQCRNWGMLLSLGPDTQNRSDTSAQVPVSLSGNYLTKCQGLSYSYQGIGCTSAPHARCLLQYEANCTFESAYFFLSAIKRS